MENQNVNSLPLEQEQSAAPVDAVAQASGKTPEQQNEDLIMRAKISRKIIAEAIAAGNLCCTPGADGHVDTSRASNPKTGTNYKGQSLLLLKQHAKNNGFPSAEYVSGEQIDFINSYMNVPFADKLKIKKGSKGVTINYLKEVDNPDGTKVQVPENLRLFNVAQLENTKVLTDFMTVRNHEQQEFVKAQLAEEGKGFKPRSSSQKKGEAIVCSSTVPQEYLGQYFAAVSTGADFVVTPEQAAAFGKAFNDALYQKNEQGKINPFNLNVICSQASKNCVELLKSKAQEKKQEKENPAKEKQPPKTKQNMDMEYDGMSM